MRPAFELYAEFLEGFAPVELARKYNMPLDRVVQRLRAARFCIQEGALLVDELRRFPRASYGQKAA